MSRMTQRIKVNGIILWLGPLSPHANIIPIILEDNANLPEHYGVASISRRDRIEKSVGNVENISLHDKSSRGRTIWEKGNAAVKHFSGPKSDKS